MPLSFEGSDHHNRLTVSGGLSETKRRHAAFMANILQAGTGTRLRNFDAKGELHVVVAEDVSTQEVIGMFAITVEEAVDEENLAQAPTDLYPSFNPDAYL